ncbi:unnamed protein product [Mycena citricolor]|uniref:Uncharacterized protein n=1 Tax=Mycena citricolor TaxID=2018698 RepID=A0AAD2HNX3_9AGAR|nr:unnamed protein product [Mycena citricolor]
MQWEHVHVLNPFSRQRHSRAVLVVLLLSLRLHRMYALLHSIGKATHTDSQQNVAPHGRPAPSAPDRQRPCGAPGETMFPKPSDPPSEDSGETDTARHLQRDGPSMARLPRFRCKGSPEQQTFRL